MYRDRSGQKSCTQKEDRIKVHCAWGVLALSRVGARQKLTGRMQDGCIIRDGRIERSVIVDNQWRGGNVRCTIPSFSSHRIRGSVEVLDDKATTSCAIFSRANQRAPTSTLDVAGTSHPRLVKEGPEGVDNTSNRAFAGDVGDTGIRYVCRSIS